MFKKYKPEEIADHFYNVVCDGANNFGEYIRIVRPNDAERTRLMLTTLLVPISVSFGWVVQRTKNTKLKDAILQAYDIYLGRLADQDQIVKIGDYVIWRIEQEHVARVLREEFCQLVLNDDIGNHEIRYGMLVRAISNIRKKMYQTDVERGISLSEDTKQQLSSGFISAGITFTRQVLKIDPNNPLLDESERERFQVSTGFASAFLGESFFKITDMFKAMGA